MWLPGERDSVYTRLHAYDALCSMRLLWSAGPALERNHVMAYNCSFMVVNRLSAFREALFILMSGTGVGYSVEEEYVAELPRIKKIKRVTPEVFVVPDSTEGWCDALDAGIETWWNGGDIAYDFSQVRPPGAKLKTKGGRASGPEPLRSALTQIREIIRARAGRNATTLLVHDIMCLIAQVVVVGGIRRASLISLSSLDDLGMRSAKQGAFWNSAPWRAMANNSVAYEHKPTAEEFLDEWVSMVKGKSGERGIFNREAFRSTSPRRGRFADVGTNPCFAAGTLVVTSEGHERIEDLVGKEATVWDGQRWVTINNFRVTGTDQDIWELTLSNGQTVQATNYHKFILADGSRKELGALQVGDVLMEHDQIVEGTVQPKGCYLKGFLVGDGTSTDNQTAAGVTCRVPILHLYSTKWECQDRILASLAEVKSQRYGTNDVTQPGFNNPAGAKKTLQGLSSRRHEFSGWPDAFKLFLPDEILNWTTASKAEFIAGVMDADGSAMDTANGFGYQISSVNLKWLQDFQRLLISIGVKSRIAKNKDAGDKDFGNRGGVCKTKPLFRLTIAQRYSVELANKVSFSRLKSFRDRSVAYKSKPRPVSVAKIEAVGLHDEVYCCTVPDSHAFALSAGIVVGQCGEINLRDEQFCNLSEIVCRPDDNRTSLVEKIKAATIFGTIQASLTDFPYLNARWKTNCEEEALLGVSATGQMDCPAFRDPDVMRELKRTYIEVNEDFARRIGINQAAAIGCVKPSGTASLLVNSSSGQHTRWSKFYLRRIRLNTGDPMLNMFRAMGMVINPDPVTPSTWVVDFPIKAPEGSTTRHDLSALEQLEYWKSVKLNFCEHNPSATIYFKAHESIAVANWVYENWKIVGGLSFLPSDDHVYPLAPHEEITEEEYNRRMETFPQIDDETFADTLALYESDDMTTGATEFSCTGGVCETAV